MYPTQVLLSVANKHHAGLRQLQFERVRREACMMRRVLSVCFNISDGLGMQEDARPYLHRTVPTPGFTQTLDVCPSAGPGSGPGPEPDRAGGPDPLALRLPGP